MDHPAASAEIGRLETNKESVRQCPGVDFRNGVVVEMQNTGSAELQRDVAAMVEQVLADRPGDWRVSIVGSLDGHRWELKIFGPHAFEQSYTLEGAAGEHDPRVIGGIVSRMVPAKMG